MAQAQEDLVRSHEEETRRMEEEQARVEEEKRKVEEEKKDPEKKRRRQEQEARAASLRDQRRLREELMTSSTGSAISSTACLPARGPLRTLFLLGPSTRSMPTPLPTSAPPVKRVVKPTMHSGRQERREEIKLPTKASIRQFREWKRSWGIRRRISPRTPPRRHAEQKE